MKRMILTGILVLATGLSTLMAQQTKQGQGQQQGQQAQQAPAQPQLLPNTKSAEETAAIQALFAAAQGPPDGIIKAADDLIMKYADLHPQYKEMALYLEAAAYQQKGGPDNMDKAQIYAEKVLEINPKNFQMMLMVGELLAQRTRENDLDKEEKLSRAEKLLNGTIETLATSPKPNPGITDAQWEEGKKFLTAQAHNDLGLVALVRKKHDVAVAEFKKAIELDPQPAYQVRLASSYQSTGNNAEAIAIVDKLIADPQTHPQIKNVAEQIKKAASQGKK